MLLRIDAQRVQSLLATDTWQDRLALRELLGGGTMLAHASSPRYSYLAVDAALSGPPLRPALRAVAVLNIEHQPAAVVNFGLLGAGTPVTHQSFFLDPPGDLYHQSIRPRPDESTREQEYLSVTASKPIAVSEVRGPDLTGIRLGDWVLLFHTEAMAAGSPQSFEVLEGERLHFLVTGLVPGIWEIWRNGWLEQMDGMVRAGTAVLEFEGRPGHYFLRKL